MQTRSVISWLLAVCAGVLGTAQFHMGQLATGFDKFFGDRGDVRGFAYFCEHWYLALQGKTDLLSPGIFYPVKGTLAYSDLLMGCAIPYAMFRALGFGMFTSVELVVILVAFLAYLACLFLLRVVLGFGMFASSAAALFFALNSPKFFQTNHLQLQFVLFLPLIFICLISFAKNAPSFTQKKAAFYLSLAGLFFVLQLMTAFYHAWFFVFWGFLFAVLTMLFKRSRQFMLGLIGHYWRAMLFSAAVLFIGLALFILVYIPAIRVSSWYEYSFVKQMIPEWWSLLSMGHGNYLWGWLSAKVTPNPPPDTWGELKVGLGALSSLLWIVITVSSFWLLWRNANQAVAKRNTQGGREVAMVFLALMILATTIFYMIGMRYGGNSPWYFVYKFFPGGGAIRAVARYVVFLTLPMAIAFAFVFDRALEWASKLSTPEVRRGFIAAVVLIAGVVVVEQFSSHKVGGTGFSVKTEEAYLKAMAAKLPADCEAFYISPGPGGTHNTYEYQYDAMLISILSRVPTLNASSSQFPPNWTMYFVKERDYEDNVKKWIAANQLKGRICKLEVEKEVEAFGPYIPNPIDDPEFFVAQNYRDLLKREPRNDEIESWSKKIRDCDASAGSCERARVTLEMAPFSEYSANGSFVVRMYQIGLGRLPRLQEFDSDFAQLQRDTEVEGLDTAKTKLTENLVTKPEFSGRHEGTSEQQYQQRLLEVLGSKINIDVGAKPNSNKAQVLKSVVDNKAVADLLSDRVFVTLLYFGYLRRDPEPAGFEQWLKTLGENKDRKHLMAGFINSTEYRRRFSRLSF